MIPEIERKAVLALFPYFSKRPYVIDVGGNIGDWTTVIVENVDRLHFYEPNTILRHYAQVRFRHLKHIAYHEQAVSDKPGMAEFLYFEDEHDGLSNIIGNDRWDYLKPKRRAVETCTLMQISYDVCADLVKIDVEGAELKVLMGAESALERRNFRFIQIEKADHINVNGYPFEAVIKYVERFGYRMFHFDGANFVPYTNQEAENLYIMDKNFSQDWNKEFIKNTAGMKFDFVLEIGCFEGLTSRYICDNLLNPGGRMIAVDPLTDEYLPGHKDNEMFVGQYERFIRNTKTYPVELIRKKSNEVFDQLKDYRFGLIYVDGDHREESVFNDGNLAFHLCRPNGYILFDDYDGYDEGTKRGVDKFLSSLPAGKFELVSKGYQLMIRKLANLN